MGYRIHKGVVGDAKIISILHILVSEKVKTLIAVMFWIESRPIALRFAKLHFLHSKTLSIYGHFHIVEKKGLIKGAVVELKDISSLEFMTNGYIHCRI